MSTNKGVARSGARPGDGGVLQAIKMPPAPGRVPPAPRRVDVMLGFKDTYLGVDFRVYTRLLYQAAPAPRGPAAVAREPHGNTHFELGIYRRFVFKITLKYALFYSRNPNLSLTLGRGGAAAAAAQDEGEGRGGERGEAGACERASAPPSLARCPPSVYGRAR